MKGRPAQILFQQWADIAIQHLHGWFDNVPAPLKSRLSILQNRLAPFGNGNLARAFFSPHKTPFPQLMFEHATQLGIVCTSREQAAVQGIFALYCTLRILDDVVDEPEVFGRDHVYLAQHFSVLSDELFAQAVGGSTRFWTFKRALLTEMAAVSAWEVDVLRASNFGNLPTETTDLTVKLGAKLAPLGIGLFALSCIADRERDSDWIAQFSKSFGAGLQVANDLLNARPDHIRGFYTPVLIALYSRGLANPNNKGEPIWPTLVGHPVFDELLQVARSHCQAAEKCAQDAGAAGVAQVVRDRLAAMDDLKMRLLALSLGSRT
ncbi:MAG: hypothetical protein IPK82_14165 [Polyangiaceae bacterium]|nr:hypothetical protein [Polyangiaceae bacterium]